MRQILCRMALALALALGTAAGAAALGDGTVAHAAAEPQLPSVRAGGKGATVEAAIEMMKREALKKVLAQLTAWSEDPASPFQQLEARYREFVGKERVTKKGTAGSGHFVLGEVPIRADLLQEELSKLVAAERMKDTDTRTVYVLVRFLGASSEDNERRAEAAILDRYTTQLKGAGFDIAKSDQILHQLPRYHGLDYDQFVAQVRSDLENESDVTIAVVGEIYQGALEDGATGFTATCDINVRAFDCVNGFKLITNYEGSDVIQRQTREEAGKFLLEKAAITSSKAIANRMMLYWKEQGAGGA